MCFLCLFPVFIAAQKKVELPVANVVNMKKAANKMPKGEPIYLEKAKLLRFDKNISPDAQVVTGDVCFRQEGARLFCDSALFYNSTNSLLALGNVHMEQGDTLFLYGAWMYYDGNARLAKVRENVRLENRSVTLFTDSLNYDRNASVGYFFDGGLLVDENENGTNELSSEYGQYSPESKEAWFKNDVKLVNPDFVLTTQQLFYNTRTEIARIQSATEIKSDSAYIYSTKGWYNTGNKQSHLLNQSYVISKHKRITADTLDYNQASGIGEGFGHVLIEDSAMQITLKGLYGYSNDSTNFALVTGNALLMEHSSKDTLFLHADTLQTNMDSVYRQVNAHYRVRLYRSDLQGVCDSLAYSTKDSVLRFYERPVLWSEDQQLTGNYIELLTKRNKPYILQVEKSAMVIAHERDSLYNQSSGKDLRAYFDSTGMEVIRVEIDGNAETIYLPLDGKEITGLNRLEGSSLIMYRKNGQLEKLRIWPKPKGKLYPLDKVPADQRYLNRFIWYGAVRPTDPQDVFRIVKPEELPSEKQKVNTDQNQEGPKSRERGIELDHPDRMTVGSKPKQPR